MSACTVEKERFSQRRLSDEAKGNDNVCGNNTFSFLITSLVYDQHLDKHSLGLKHELKMSFISAGCFDSGYNVTGYTEKNLFFW